MLAAYTVKAQVETNPAHSDLDATWSEKEATSAQSEAELFLYGKSEVHFTLKNTSPEKNNDGSDNTNCSYAVILQVKNGNNVKGSAIYGVIRNSSGTKIYPITIDSYTDRSRNTNRTVRYYKYVSSEVVNGDEIEGTIQIDNGADDDYLWMELIATSRIGTLSAYTGVTESARSTLFGTTYSYSGQNEVSFGSGSVGSILSKLSTSTTRYDIYDDKPLFTKDGENTTITDPEQVKATIQSNRIVDHSSAISVYVHRSLKKGTWGTLCLPFNVTVANMKNANALGNDVVIAEFDNVDLDNNIVNFKSITSSTTILQAGKPYLIYYNGEDKNEFFAPHVTFTQSGVRAANAFASRKSAKTDKGYYFEGLLEPYGTKYENTTSEAEALSGDKTIVYIANPTEGSTEQHLKKLSANGSMKAFRAYLVYPASGASAAAKGNGVIDVDGALNGGTTAVTKVTVDGKQVSNNIYNLNGQFVGVDAGNLPAGIYVRGGKKFVVK